MRGKKTSKEDEDKFAGEYLKTGNASEAARCVGIGIDAGLRIAKQLRADPSFRKQADSIRARALEEAELVMMESLAEAQSRFHKYRPYTADELAKIVAEHDVKLSYKDAGPEYLKCITDAYKALTANRRAFDSEGSDKPTKVVIEVTTTEGAQARIAEDGDDSED